MIRRILLVKISIYFILFILPVIIYFSVSGHQFITGWDDSWMVLNRYTIGGLKYFNIASIFSETYYGQYSPVNQLIYTVLYSIFGADPRAFHLASVFYHAINVCLVFTFVKMLLGFRESEKMKLVLIASFITALLFAVHPFNTEAIAWISASKVPLYTMFGLSAFLFYMRYLQSNKMIWFVVCNVFFLLSFGCKEQAAILPLTLILIDWYTGRDFRKKKLWLEKIPFLLLVTLGGLFTLSLRNMDYVQYLAGYPLGQRLIFAFYAIIEYLTKLIIPIKLMYLYPFLMMPGEAMPLRFLIYPLIVAALGGIIVYYRKHALLVFCALFFVLNVSLTLHIVSMSRVTIVADRWIYLSGVGFFMAVAWYGIKGLMRLSKVRKIIACSFFVVYLCYLTGYTMKHSEIWHDNDSLKKVIRELIEQREDYVPKDIVINNEK